MDDDFDGSDLMESAVKGVLPWAHEAEAAYLGSLMLEPGLFAHVTPPLRIEAFHRPFHRAIYEAILQREAARPGSFDVVGVYEAMQHAGTLGDHTAQDIAALAQWQATPANMQAYAETLREKALMRGLLEAAETAREAAIEPGMTAAQRLDRCMQAFTGLTALKAGRDPVPVYQIAVSMLDRLQDLADGRIEPGIPTRLPTLDRLLGGGLKPGKNIVVAARPSVGKSAFAMEIARALVAENIPAAILSQEMEGVELVDRLTARVSSVDLDKLTTGQLDDQDFSAVAEAIERIGAMPLYIDDQPGLTLADIQAKARKLARERGIKLLVLDYLQLCASTKAGDSRHHQIEEISRGLKTLAKELGITTLVLSQLNREVEKRPGGRPVLADLKESGAIEEDADAIIMLSQDAIRPTGEVVVHAEVAKNRGGAKGFLKLGFMGRWQRFVETVAEDVQPKKRRPLADDF